MKVMTCIKNTGDYVLTLTKSECDRPSGVYKILLTEYAKENGVVPQNSHELYMTESELQIFSKALLRKGL